MSFSLRAILLIAACSVFFSQPALAQNCRSSFAVQPTKSLIYFGWLPDGAGASGVASMKCSAADEMRTKIFINYLSDSEAQIFATPASYKAEIIRRYESLVAKRNELRSKLDDGTPIAALRIVSQVTWYEAGKFFLIVGCVAPDPTLITKAACVYGVVELVRGTVDMVGSMGKPEIKEKLQLVSDHLASIEPAYRQAVQAANAEKVRASKDKFAAAFLGLCQAIKDQCL